MRWFPKITSCQWVSHSTAGWAVNGGLAVVSVTNADGVGVEFVSLMIVEAVWPSDRDA